MSPLSPGSSLQHSARALPFLLGISLLLLTACQSEPDTPPSPDTTAVDSSVGSAASSTANPTQFAPPEDVTVPKGMVYVPGGSTRIGISTDTWNALKAQQPSGPRHLFGRDAHPAFRTHVDPFFLDVHPVTVAQFRAFVDSTGYTTQAEDFGNGAVLRQGRWQLVQGATWHHPRGPNQSAAPEDHPVTQVSWNDAQAYCKWADKRLPTEVEWEHAARMGQEPRALCPWDGSCTERSARLANANTWQGRFPIKNTAADGYRYTSPVGTFGETPLGLQDMSGNVWEWTASWKRPYEERGTGFSPTKRSERVQRGGSFICNECGGYFLFSRSSATPETSLFHVGFRCAQDSPP